MKRLVVLRHAKSSWDSEGVSDIDRPLKTRGINDAYALSRELKELLKGIDLVLCSPANRALHTAAIFSEGVGFAAEKIKVTAKIYEANESALRKLIMEVDSTVNTLMVVGHNPTFTYFVNEMLPHPIYELPTTGCVIFNFDIESWAQLASSKLTEYTIHSPQR